MIKPNLIDAAEIADAAADQLEDVARQLETIATTDGTYRQWFPTIDRFELFADCIRSGSNKMLAAAK